MIAAENKVNAILAQTRFHWLHTKSASSDQQIIQIKAEMAESEGIQAIVNQLAFQAATAAVLALQGICGTQIRCKFNQPKGTQRDMADQL